MRKERNIILAIKGISNQLIRYMGKANRFFRLNKLNTMQHANAPRHNLKRKKRVSNTPRPIMLGVPNSMGKGPFR